MANALVNQTPTILGALTTTFIPPPACTAAIGIFDGGFLGLGKSALNIAHLGQTCSRGEGREATTCWPSTSKGAPSKSAPGWGIYSPGIECPAGYVTACSAVGGRDAKADWSMQFRLGADETAVGCCPSGYACGNIGGQTCIQVMVSTTLPTISCDGTKSKTSTVTVPNSKASMADFTLLAPMIQINWQASDRPASSTAPSRPPLTTGPAATSTSSADPNTDVDATDSPSVAQPTDTSTPAAGSPDANTNDPNPDAQRKGAESEGSGLATATKVGLGIGAGVAAIALVLGVVFYMWRRRRSQLQEDELDRLYGLKQIGPDAHSSTNLSGGGMKDDIPGWYRGQRPLQNTTAMVPPTLSPSYMPPQGMPTQGMPTQGMPMQGMPGQAMTTQGMSAVGPSGPHNPYIDSAGLQAPAAPYYRPYRPGA
ncbi:hypothetical protein QBC39DRAFT_262909 [Podospora conica]|nr:hypothetical protein QBC39DRAFT_262909 [Schizothecium conicum]